MVASGDEAKRKIWSRAGTVEKAARPLRLVYSLRISIEGRSVTSRGFGVGRKGERKGERVTVQSQWVGWSMGSDNGSERAKRKS